MPIKTQFLSFRDMLELGNQLHRTFSSYLPKINKRAVLMAPLDVLQRLWEAMRVKRPLRFTSKSITPKVKEVAAFNLP